MSVRVWELGMYIVLLLLCVYMCVWCMMVYDKMWRVCVCVCVCDSVHGVCDGGVCDSVW